MMSVSCHITPLVINSVGSGDTHTHTLIPTIRTGSILRHQARAGLWPVHARFKNSHIVVLKMANFWLIKLIPSQCVGGSKKVTGW